MSGLGIPDTRAGCEPLATVIVAPLPLLFMVNVLPVNK